MPQYAAARAGPPRRAGGGARPRRAPPPRGRAGPRPAALAGQGIALGRMALIGGLIAERRLVAIGGADSQSAQGFAYWLIQAEANPRDDVQTVIDWIEAEAETVESQGGGTG